MKHIKIILLLLGILFLVGCVHFKPKLSTVFEQESRAKTQQKEKWYMRGSLSITCNKKRDIAVFNWRQNKDKYLINISGPMNLGKIKIIGNANKAWLCRANNQCVTAKTPEKLLFSQLGWKLPVSNIRYWVFALPAPDKVNAANFDQHNHLIVLKQQNWVINYSNFQTIKNIDLPTTIELSNHNILIKLKIKEYFL